jgi:two-component system cell cycle sensor histidine kinase/response regulator CckA
MTTFQTKLDVALLLESAAWPAFLVDPAGLIRRANKAAIELFGPVLRGDAAPVTSILSAEHQSDPARFLAQLEQSVFASVSLNFKTKDGAATAAIPTSICAFTRDGEKRFLFQLHGNPVAAPAVAPAKSDTTAAAAAPKQKVDRATQLARSVALDLNNTLTSIIGHCSWILSHMEPDHKWRKSMEEISRAAIKSAEIAENLAAFSRSDKEKEATISTNVNALLKRLQQDFQQVNDKRIEWSIELEDQLYSARCDENKLLQLLTRIIENAVQSGAVLPRITVQTRNTDLQATLHDANLRLQPGCYVCVEIADNGRGIPPEILPRVFEPFFSTKPGHKGLGLAWVYGAITNAGGGVAISSLGNQGTSVRIYVPAHKRVSRETAIVALRPDAGTGKTILLVDDEDLVLSVGKTVLSASGYKVITVRSAEKALEVLAEKHQEINLAIIDWVMPQFSGKELMERIRAEYPSLPVLCTSGYAHVPSTTGNTDFLQKPFTTQKLLERVKEKLTPPSSAAA